MNCRRSITEILLIRSKTPNKQTNPRVYAVILSLFKKDSEPTRESSQINPLPDDKILDRSKLKHIPDDILNCI